MTKQKAFKLPALLHDKFPNRRKTLVRIGEQWRVRIVKELSGLIEREG